MRFTQPDPEKNSYPQALRWRHRFTVLCVLTTVVLIGWGGFVTSINAGLAVPDWPTSFNSLDPFNPWPDWWTVTPILAEHGHRLIGALVGAMTLILAVWTWLADRRSWMKKLGVGILALVIAQGVLGGLRVVWVSLDLAVVHAGVAQIYFSLIVAMALFTSREWVQGGVIPADSPQSSRLRRYVLLTVTAVYGQILLGALLRHPGTGIDSFLAAIHIAGAFVSAGFIIASFLTVRWFYASYPLLNRASWIMLSLLGVQLLLGLSAYFVLLDEAGMIQPSNLQVVINTTHLVIGALLLSSTVALALPAMRRSPEPDANRIAVTSAGHQQVHVAVQ